MSVIDVDNLLQPISPELPCGEDLEYDPMFVEMEEAAQGTPERQSGDTIIPPEEPHWHEVRSKTLELLARTKDLRVAVYLNRALLHTSGLVGMNDGLALLQGLLDRYWEPVHPHLDPDDDYDPTLRVNTILTLCDPETTLRSVRETPLVSSRTIGRFSLRDIDIASGKLTIAHTDNEAPPAQMSVIDAAFMDCDSEELRAMTAAVGSSVEHVKMIEDLVTERVGAAQAPNLAALRTLLKEIHQILAERLSRRGISDTGAEGITEQTAAEEGATGAAGSEGIAGVVKPAKSISGEVGSREDVIRLLDKICDYYKRSEPSSPVPLLLKRARRLVALDFMEILRDLAPDSVAQIETLRGPGGGEDSSG